MKILKESKKAEATSVDQSFWFFFMCFHITMNAQYSSRKSLTPSIPNSIAISPCLASSALQVLSMQSQAALQAGQMDDFSVCKEKTAGDTQHCCWRSHSFR